MFRFLSILIFCLTTLQAAGAPPTVLVVGDSLSAGYGLNAGESWVSLLQHRLKEEGYGYRVVNASISGDTSRGGRERLPKALEVHSPSVVIIELGGNDGLRGIAIGEMRQNLTTMVEASLGKNARVVLLPMRIPSNYGPAYTQRFEQVYADIIEQFNLPEAGFLLDDVATNPELMQSDGIHPTAEAQSVILANIWPSLETILNDMPVAVGGDSG